MSIFVSILRNFAPLFLMLASFSILASLDLILAPSKEIQISDMLVEKLQEKLLFDGSYYILDAKVKAATRLFDVIDHEGIGIWTNKKVANFLLKIVYHGEFLDSRPVG
jgi:hypothetical protein